MNLDTPDAHEAVRRLTDLGFHPADAAHWCHHWPFDGPVDAVVEVLLDFKKAGFDLHDAAEWATRCLFVEPARVFSRHGYTPAQASWLTVHALDPIDWVETGLDPAVVLAFVDGDIPLTEAIAWHDHGFHYPDLLDFRNLGYSPEAARRVLQEAAWEAQHWLDSSLEPDLVLAFIKAGISPHHTGLWMQMPPDERLLHLETIAAIRNRNLQDDGEIDGNEG